MTSAAAGPTQSERAFQAARQGKARRGGAWLTWQGEADAAWRGGARRGWARLGPARPGLAWLTWPGQARRGMARRGLARLGEAWYGAAGMPNPGRIVEEITQW